ncbi:hypothetical protein [Pyrodictium abyssi]|uniref:hypothetical protein n=1 Tax=Pyrodictium abyssi TaxID=54256 RepID=UPI0030C7361E
MKVWPRPEESGRRDGVDATVREVAEALVALLLRLDAAETSMAWRGVRLGSGVYDIVLAVRVSEDDEGDDGKEEEVA